MKKFFTLILVIFLGLSAQAKQIEISEDNGIYHIVLSGKAIKKRIHFISTKNLTTNKEVHKNYDSLLTINTGFFDPKNSKTISYIVNDGITLENPLLNDNLILNPLLRANLKKITNRSEFRILQCDRELKYEIARHNDPVDIACEIRTAAQGGPQLLPEMNLEDEFFILKDKEGKNIRQSASVLDKTARTLVGIKDDNMHILIVTNKNPMTIYEAQELCKSLKLDSAMAFDGGSSTSLNYKKINVTSIQLPGFDTGRKLKSFMIVTKK